MPSKAGQLGGSVIVSPFEVSGIARIALIADAVGAQIGLWETVGQAAKPNPTTSRLPSPSWAAPARAGWRTAP